jgi:solute carrier family 9B (sodium/hydrogen exchanger), member 1/2
MKAGLGLDRAKLIQQGSVALRLGILPAACEALTIAVVAMGLFHFNFPTGLLLGLIVSAESPAVIVPGMLQLKRLGWGVGKGIPDAILTGSALSNVLVLLLFNLLLTTLSTGGGSGLPIGLLPFQLLGQIGGGLIVGWLAAKILVVLLSRQTWTKTAVQETIVSAGMTLFIVVLSRQLPIYSGYMAVISAGFWLTIIDPPLTQRLRLGFDGLWSVAQIWLFVLLGATIQLDVLGAQFWAGLFILTIGTFVGRSIGWYLSTLGSNWNWRERLFLLPGNSAKATVQAAIGAMPLAQGIAGGETILAIAMLSILVTAPIGAWAIPRFAPRLLVRGELE